ncbi:MAG: hypothetical protein VST67_08625 [Nitrospirota bacterium]|nr:hypothetical protein [Nitrospirota bacterium]
MRTDGSVTVCQMWLLRRLALGSCALTHPWMLSRRSVCAESDLRYGDTTVDAILYACYLDTVVTRALSLVPVAEVSQVERCRCS